MILCRVDGDFLVSSSVVMETEDGTHAGVRLEQGSGLCGLITAR